MTDEKNKFANECSDQQRDLDSLRTELLRAEQTRLAIESEKVTLNEKIKFLETEKDRVEINLDQVTRERNDLSNQLSLLARKKSKLDEELNRLEQKLEQSNTMNARINKDLKDLVKDNEEKQASVIIYITSYRIIMYCTFFIIQFLLSFIANVVRNNLSQVLLETNAKEFQRLQEQCASMRIEKEALEELIFNTEKNLETMHGTKTQLEKEQKEMLTKQESLKEQVARLTTELENSEKRAQSIKQSLTQQSGNQIAEFEQIISNMKKQSEDSVKKVIDEKVRIYLFVEF
jgi:rootletin